MKKLVLVLLLCPFLSAGTGNGNGRLGVILEKMEKHHHDGSVQDFSGVMVGRVLEDSGADRAGIESGDIIVTINGESVAQNGDVLAILKDTKPGEEAKVKVLRAGSEFEFVVALSGDEVFPNPEKRQKWIFIHENRPWLGIQMQDLSPQLAEYFKVKAGVLVTSVNEDSPAQKAGLKAGDIITQLADLAVADGSDLHRAISKQEAGASLPLVWMRNGKKMQQNVVLEKKQMEDGAFSYSFGGNDAQVIHDIPRIEWHQKETDLEKQIESLRQEIESLRKELKKD